MIKELTNEQIESELESISNKIDELYNRQDALSKELRRRDTEKIKITNDILKLSEHSLVIAVAKRPDYHFTMIQCFEDICEDRFGLEYTHHTYRLDDYDLSYHVVKMRSSLSTFHDLISEYDLYSVSEDADFDALVSSMARLLVTDDNYKTIAESFVKGLTLGSIRT